MTTIHDSLRTWQNVFNDSRNLVDIGKKLLLIEKYLDRTELMIVGEHFKTGDVTWLKIWLKSKEKKNDRQTEETTHDEYSTGAHTGQRGYSPGDGQPIHSREDSGEHKGIACPPTDKPVSRDS